MRPFQSCSWWVVDDPPFLAGGEGLMEQEDWIKKVTAGMDLLEIYGLVLGPGFYILADLYQLLLFCMISAPPLLVVYSV